MAKRGIGIAGRLIIISTILLGLVVGLFGVINSMQSRRIIDEHVNRHLKDSILHLRDAGATELRLLLKAVGVALSQSDFASLRAVVGEMGKQKDRITVVTVVDPEGRILAHNDQRLVGSRAQGELQRVSRVSKLSIFDEVKFNGKPSMVFAAPVQQAVSQNGRAGQHRLGTAVLGLNLAPLKRQVARTEQVKRKEVRTTVKTTLLVGLLSLLLGTVLTVIQALRMTRPIQALALQADRMAGGDLQARVDPGTRDEIGMLGRRFNHMAEQIVELMEQTKEKAEMEKELEVARVVQGTLVPAEKVTRIADITLAGYFKPATQCGGDWWNYYELPGGQVMVVIGDVTGHGVGSAMITAAAKGAASTLVSATGGGIELQTLLKQLNGAILSTAHGEFAMTCFASIYDSRHGTLSYSNAGHNAPYLYRASTGEVSALALRSDRLGDFEDSTFDIREAKVGADDVVFWYTDGLVEGPDRRGEQYGEQRFQEAIRRTAGLEPERALELIVEDASRHFDGAEQLDDITLVVGRVGG